MLQDFFGRSGKQPDQVTAQDIFVYAHGPGLSGKQPSAITIGARIACLSSFYRFLIRMDIVQSNPCDKLQRPQTSPSPPRGLSGSQVHQLLGGSSRFTGRPQRQSHNCYFDADWKAESRGAQHESG